MAAAVAAHGLSGTRLQLPPAPLDDDVWNRLFRRTTNERVPGLLVEAIESGAFPVTARQHEEATRLHTAALYHSVVLERRLLDTIACLESAGIPYRALKGSAVAHTVYRSPALRAFGDVDLLVPSERFEEAAARLEQSGCHRTIPPLRHGFDRRFAKGVSLICSDGLQIDLHRTLALGFFGLSINPDALFDTATPFRLGGRTVLALGPEERLLHACYHAAIGHRLLLVMLRDVAEFVLNIDLDVDRVLRLARGWSAEAVVARAVRLTWETFDLADVVPLSVWAARYQPGRWERRAVESYVGARRSEAARALLAVRAIPQATKKIAFLGALLVPHRDYLAWKGEGRLRWLARSRRAVLRQQGSP